MKIYDVENFPNPIRVRIALAEKGVLQDVTFENIDVMSGEHRQAAFKAKNPAATVPVLELEDGTHIGECSAITEYIDQHCTGISLTGTTAKQRAVIAMMNRRAEFMVLEAVSTYFHHATPGLGPALEHDQNPAWGEKQKEAALKGLQYFDGVLSNQAFAAGDAFSMADITLFAALAFADFAGIEISNTHSALHTWRNQMMLRPSIAA